MDIYLVVCYFLPKGSDYAVESAPYSVLYDDTVEFSRIGEVMLARNFNARTASKQACFFDVSYEMFQDVDLLDV